MNISNVCYLRSEEVEIKDPNTLKADLFCRVPSRPITNQKLNNGGDMIRIKHSITFILLIIN